MKVIGSHKQGNVNKALGNALIRASISKYIAGDSVANVDVFPSIRPFLIEYFQSDEIYPTVRNLTNRGFKARFANLCRSIYNDPTVRPLSSQQLGDLWRSVIGISENLYNEIVGILNWGWYPIVNNSGVLDIGLDCDLVHPLSHNRLGCKCELVNGQIKIGNIGDGFENMQCYYNNLCAHRDGTGSTVLDIFFTEALRSLFINRPHRNVGQIRLVSPYRIGNEIHFKICFDYVS